MNNTNTCLEVKYSTTTNENDIFNGETVYINEIFLTEDDDSNEKDKYEPATELYFSKMNHVYINVQSTFDSILDFGRKIIKNPDIFDTPGILNEINNINNISDEFRIHKEDYKIIVRTWLENNFYPYAKFNKENFVITFMRDTTICYVIYEIHKWLIKISNTIEKIVEKPKKHHELLNVKNLLDYLDFDTILFNTNLNDNILNLPESYNPNEDYYFYINFSYDNLNKDEIIKYCEIVRRNLIGYITTLINNDLINFQINKQRPFYEPNKSQYRIIETGSSLIGIVYNKLLFCLSVNKSAFNRSICKNKDCNNEFIKIGRREWCQTPECQRARNREKQKSHKL